MRFSLRSLIFVLTVVCAFLAGYRYREWEGDQIAQEKINNLMDMNNRLLAEQAREGR